MTTPKPRLTRRQALESVGRALGSRTSTPLDELVNSLEFEQEAKRVLSEEVFASIAGSDRSVFDRYTFRPRMNVPTLDMDLSVEVLGQMLFTPIVVGPIAEQRRFHPDGELATIVGASEARTSTIVSSDASKPISEMAATASEAAMPFWLAVTANADAPARAERAASAGVDALFLTVDSEKTMDWAIVEAVRSTVDVPVVLKGVMSTANARMAVERGLNGVVVSNYGGLAGGSSSAPIPELAAVADAIGRDVPILVDGSFRRATDILVALILGARTVLLGRPVMWALASYGAEGVTTLLQMLQSDLARCFAMLGASNVAALTRDHVRIHQR